MERELNTTAIDHFEPDERLEMLAETLAHDQARLALLPLTAKLHTAWQEDPVRVHLFAIDNSPLPLPLEELMALDYLPDWHRGMWEQGVADDSYSKLEVLWEAGVKPTSEPAMTFVDALHKQQYEVAALYLDKFGQNIAEGLAESWTQTCGLLWKLNDQRARSTAWMLIAVMRHHKPAIWKRDLEKLAVLHPSGDPVKELVKFFKDNEGHYDVGFTGYLTYVGRKLDTAEVERKLALRTAGGWS